jgi:hypothetical protein
VTILIAGSSTMTHAMQVSHHITCELQLNDGSHAGDVQSLAGQIHTHQHSNTILANFLLRVTTEAIQVFGAPGGQCNLGMIKNSLNTSEAKFLAT